MSVPSKMEVNAAIGDIIAQKDVEAAAVVLIRFAQTLKKVVRLRGGTKTQNRSIVRKTKKTLLGEQGLKRVGNYEIWLQDYGLIQFAHFTVATASPQDLSQIKFSIRFDPKTNDLIYVSENHRVEVFRFRSFAVIRWTSEPIMGKPPKYESPVEFSLWRCEP